MDFNNALDRVIQFYSWIYSETGLKSWQLLIIALGVLFTLIIILSYIRRKQAHIIHSSEHSDIIGIKLLEKDSTQMQQFESEEIDDQQSWGQTTKDWRQLREKIRHLQHDIGKYERSEKLLKEQIAELKSENEKLLSKINGGIQKQPEHVGQAVKLNSIKSESQQKPIELLQTSSVESNIPEQNIPLDIKELKIIADLARKLQARSQQRQQD